MCHASSTIERTGIASVANLIVRGVRCSRSKGESVCEEIDLPWHKLLEFKVRDRALLKELEAAFEYFAKSGGLLASIFGLLSGRRVTCEYLRSELEGKWNWIDPRAIEVVCLAFD
ncbi:hypothetical protein Tco_0224054 [Tanacetum coccineum]